MPTQSLWESWEPRSRLSAGLHFLVGRVGGDACTAYLTERRAPKKAGETSQIEQHGEPCSSADVGGVEGRAVVVQPFGNEPLSWVKEVIWEHNVALTNRTCFSEQVVWNCFPRIIEGIEKKSLRSCVLFWPMMYIYPHHSTTRSETELLWNSSVAVSV